MPGFYMLEYQLAAFYNQLYLYMQLIHNILPSKAFPYITFILFEITTHTAHAMKLVQQF